MTHDLQTQTGSLSLPAAPIDALNNRRAPGRRLAAFSAAVSLLLLLTACAELASQFPATSTPAPREGPEGSVLRPVTWQELPGWNGVDIQSALPAFFKSCDTLAKRKPDAAFGPKPEMGTVGDWTGLCDQMRRIPAGDRTKQKYFLESRLQAYRVIGDDSGEGLITGYYEPELHGAWAPDHTYRVPIYSRPKDLLTVKLGDFGPELKDQTIAGRLVGDKFLPYHNRAAIDGGILAGRQLEILWVTSPIDAFFLHVQGSGKILLPDGAHVRVGYAGRNGRPYTAIGRELVRRKAIAREDVTLQSIRDWLKANPLSAGELMATNESYIFFRVVEGDGPIGAQGVPLTAGRSLAVDRRYVPLGAPVWLETHDPIDPKRPLRRLVVAQDTGSAIKGPVRGDLFFGFGAEAGAKAGRMKHPGRYYLLLPRKNTVPSG